MGLVILPWSFQEVAGRVSSASSVTVCCSLLMQRSINYIWNEQSHACFYRSSWNTPCAHRVCNGSKVRASVGSGGRRIPYVIRSNQKSQKNSRSRDQQLLCVQKSLSSSSFPVHSQHKHKSPQSGEEQNFEFLSNHVAAPWIRDLSMSRWDVSGK